jgi:hypothetical protein
MRIPSTMNIKTKEQIVHTKKTNKEKEVQSFKNVGR